MSDFLSTNSPRHPRSSKSKQSYLLVQQSLAHGSVGADCRSGHRSVGGGRVGHDVMRNLFDGRGASGGPSKRGGCWQQERTNTLDPTSVCSAMAGELKVPGPATSAGLQPR